MIHTIKQYAPLIAVRRRNIDGALCIHLANTSEAGPEMA